MAGRFLPDQRPDNSGCLFHGSRNQCKLYKTFPKATHHHIYSFGEKNNFEKVISLLFFKESVKSSAA
eukprot:m.238296 g.238296  ORF g.238296 m.238296 type:complete len:67 (+) comp40160_c1_seq2:479-679(+)